MPAWTLRLLVVGTVLAAGCSTDPCVLLVEHTCGDEDQCHERSACRDARAMQQDGVLSACEAALDNELGFPACRR